jgi:hypothetical protein
LASQGTADFMAAIAQAVHAATDTENFNSEEVRTATVISVRGDPRWRRGRGRTAISAVLDLPAEAPGARKPFITDNEEHGS